MKILLKNRELSAFLAILALFAVLAAHLLRLCFPKLRYTSTLCLLSMLGIAGAASKISVSGIWEF